MSFDISALNATKVTITEARKPVPRLDGQVPRNPSLSDHINFDPIYIYIYIEREREMRYRNERDIEYR